MHTDVHSLIIHKNGRQLVCLSSSLHIDIVIFITSSLAILASQSFMHEAQAESCMYGCWPHRCGLWTTHVDN